MVTGLVESQTRHALYPELFGARVLITGVQPAHGVDIVRAFAEAGCRLVLQMPDMTPELDVVLEDVARTAEEVRVSEATIRSETDALAFAQSAVKSYGGLEAVINLAQLNDAALGPDATVKDVEDLLVATLGCPLRMTEVIANRMQLTWTQGLILNIVTQAQPQTHQAALLGRFAHGALANLTRTVGERWADRAIRVNAITPGLCDGFEDDLWPHRLHSEAQIAVLALRLASRRGQSLSGMVFDAQMA